MFNGPSTIGLDTEYDKFKFKEFLTGHNLHNLRNISGVLVVGPMGAGKSTGIAIQLGAIYKKNPEKKGYLLERAGTYTPATSDGYTSKTLNIGSYEDSESQLMYLDTAGLDEHRGKEEKLWTKSSLDLLFSIVREIKAVVVFLDYAVTFGARAEGFRRLADEIFKVTMGAEIFYQSMVFVVTNGYDGSRKISIQDLVDDAASMLQEMIIQEYEFKVSLARRFPLGRTERAAMAVAGMVGSTSNEADTTGFNINLVPEEDKQHLGKLGATRKLLETFVASSDKLVLSYPDGRIACQEIREKLLHKIRSTQVISRTTLVNIGRTLIPGNRLLLQNLLSSIASDYLRMGLTEEATLLSTLTENYQRKHDDLDAIERDWESVKRHLITVKEQSIKAKKVELGVKQEECDRLKKSLTPMVHREDPILKESSSGFLGLKWLFRQAYSTEEYAYEGLPFLGYSFSGDDHFESKVESKPLDGILKIKFTSNHGYDLNLKVRINMYEKDLPATIERVALLETEIQTRETEITVLQRSLMILGSVTSKEQLEKEITKENTALERRVQEVEVKFEPLLSPRTTCRERDAVNKLEIIFSLLRESGMQHPSLSTANRNSIDEFLTTCVTVKKASENEYLRRLLPSVVNSQRITDTSHLEDRLPVLSGVSDNVAVFFKQSNQALATAVSSNFFRSHKFEIGFCMTLWPMLMRLEERPSMFPLAMTGVVTIGVFMMLSYLHASLNALSSNVAKITEVNKREFEHRLKEVVAEIEVESIKTAVTARNLSVFATQRLTEKFNFDVKADIKGNLKTLVDVAGVRLF